MPYWDLLQQLICTTLIVLTFFPDARPLAAMNNRFQLKIHINSNQLCILRVRLDLL